jgi:hypothetical protein
MRRHAEEQGRLSFCQCLSLAFSLSTSFGNEHSSVAQGSHKIRYGVVNFAIVDVANAVGSSQLAFLYSASGYRPSREKRGALLPAAI